MNQPAPDWQAAPAMPPAAPAPAAPLAGAMPTQPMPVAYAPLQEAPAPPMPAAPAPMPVAPAPLEEAVPATGFAIPTDPASMLDVAAPLHAVPQQQPGPPAPAPVTYADPAQVAYAGEYPTSLAMPVDMPAEPAYHGPMPVEATHEPVALAAAGAAPDGPVDAADPTGQWWSPGVALVLAVAGLAVQLVAFYARVQLPFVESSGTPLSNFDSVVGSVPLIDGVAGQVMGLLLAAGSLGILLYGSRRGLREPGLQGLVGALALAALLLTVALPKLAG